jgi:hypothetical protein
MRVNIDFTSKFSMTADEVNIFAPVMKLIFPSSLDTHPALPMGVASEDIVNFFEYRLKKCILLSHLLSS